VDSSLYKTKVSKEKTMPGDMLYSPSEINKAFKREFTHRYGWQPIRVPCSYSTAHYVEDYDARPMNAGAFREMDFA
jgi:hypothetical protein